ncbi:MAG: DUF1015 family protein [Pedobacter sp.]|nr:MAG: DUF1015 family protein [Pedobacter sp.]
MKIKSFRALMPDQDWFTHLLSSGKHSVLRSFLEPQADMTLSKLAKNTQSLDSLITGGQYHSSVLPGIYVYEQENVSGSHFGIWTLTSLQDFRENNILAHEQTLTAHAEQLRLYRENVGLEASPVLLTYQRNQLITRLTESISLHAPDHCFSDSGTKHCIWAVTDKTIQDELIAAFTEVKQVCIADGHHRMEAAAMQVGGQQWISTLYVSSGQLSSSAFHRMLLPDRPISKSSLFSAISPFFQISESAENLPVKPKRPGQLGLYFHRRWYKLELKSCAKDQPDVCLLQEEVLAAYFNMTDPRTDQRMTCWPDNLWDKMIGNAAENAETILFTLAPISPDRLLHLADSGHRLPPKSTYIQPKLPYGLLMHRLETKSLCVY